jgi:hypothetical protein
MGTSIHPCREMRAPATLGILTSGREGNGTEKWSSQRVAGVLVLKDLFTIGFQFDAHEVVIGSGNSGHNGGRAKIV